MINKEKRFSATAKMEKQQNETAKILLSASTSARQAGLEIQKGSQAIQSKNISPKLKNAIQQKSESIKQTLTKLTTLIALTLPVGMLGDMAYTETSRKHHAPTTETTPEETSQSEKIFTPRLLTRRSEGTYDSQAALTQKALFAIAAALRQQENISPSELAQLVADTAVENAMETYNESMSSEQLAQQIRREIEETCSEPSCDINEALTDAGWALDHHIDRENEFANPDETHKLLEAESEINPNRLPAGLAYAQRANRPDLMEETLQRIQDRASDEDRTGLTSIYEAIQRTSLYADPVAMESLSPGMRETIRSAYAAQEQRLRDERATLTAALERATREATNAEANPFAEIPEADVLQSPNTLSHELAVIDQQISTINNKVAELSK